MSALAQALALLGTAVIMMTALPLTGVISMQEALAGLSDPNIVLIAALFVIGEALVRTGVAQRLGDWLTLRADASEARLIFLMMLIVAGVGSFMSSTGVVAIFIPIMLRIARKARIPAGRLMMPPVHGGADQRHDDPRRYRAEPCHPRRTDPAGA
ncbi:SLC13 family permease [Pannonibacter indicus]|uniref:SLC13 family permease n=1 Tax=Pannonibacter indicus TaxID=466044 RepID=UPI00391AE552